MAEPDANPSSSNSEAVDRLMAAAGATRLADAQDGIPAYSVERDVWLDVAGQLLNNTDVSFEMLVDLTAVDQIERQPRFDVVYHLWSLRYNQMLRIKVSVPEEDATCPSVVGLWSTADWHERECFDMFGIDFENHPDLRRILMPDDYPFHPLRKDFPVEGIDNSVSYRKAGGVLMTPDLDVDRPAGQDDTPVDLSQGDPPGFSDGAEQVDPS